MLFEVLLQDFCNVAGTYPISFVFTVQTVHNYVHKSIVRTCATEEISVVVPYNVCRSFTKHIRTCSQKSVVAKTGDGSFMT